MTANSSLRVARSCAAGTAWNPRHGKWTFQFSYAGRNGKRIPVVVGGFDTEDEALDALDRAKRKVSQGVSVKGVPGGEFFESWLNSKRDIRPNTRRF